MENSAISTVTTVDIRTASPDCMPAHTAKRNKTEVNSTPDDDSGDGSSARTDLAETEVQSLRSCVEPVSLQNQDKIGIVPAEPYPPTCATADGRVVGDHTTHVADGAGLGEHNPNDVATEDRSRRDTVEFLQVYNVVWSQKPGLQSRVHRLVSSSDNECGRYNIFNLPRDQLEWMSIGPQPNKQVLTLDDDPVRFWIVGVVARDGAHLAAADGTNNRQVSVCVHPVRAGEHSQWSSFLQDLGGIQLPYSPINGTLTARRRMVFRQGGHGIVAPFNNCFDARRTLRPYTVMDKWAPENVDENNLIVMEVRIDRWKCDNIGNVLRYSTWNNYRAGLELLAVSMLLKGSVNITQGPSAIVDVDDYDF